jgi:hypothetical protein
VAPSPKARQPRPSRQRPGPGFDCQTESTALDYAAGLIHRVCHLAGDASLIDNIRADLDEEGVREAITTHDTATIFDWLVAGLSYQGISNQVAHGYMEAHGSATWQGIEADLQQPVKCRKLASYWQFHGCRYHKTTQTCAEPDLIDQCPLPTHDLRNGRLNQAAYSLYLFIRDIAGGDLVGWIDNQFAAAGLPGQPSWAARAGEALVGPLRHVYGVSDKLLTMVLSGLLIGAPDDRRHWIEVGARMVAVDTLVHNFLVRTGVLGRLAADHPYGAACYGPTGCAEILDQVARRIDAREFNPRFPRTFPRFVQLGIWQYCAQDRFDVCNGNRIDDRQRCDNVYCQLRSICDRIVLNNGQ